MMLLDISSDGIILMIILFLLILLGVPIILSMPPTGDRGEVGAIDVDVETGQLQITPELIEAIEHRAEYLVANSPS